jgi:hypothetical protein
VRGDERMSDPRSCGRNRRPHFLLTDSDYAHGERFMTINLALQPVVALICGILILLMPRLLNYIVAIYLIVIGIMGLIR